MTPSKASKTVTDFILYGGPGSGKTTVAEILTSHFNLYHFYGGAIFRSMAKEKTLLGRTVAKYIAAGKLVPKHLNRQVVDTATKDVAASTPILFDGFPRTYSQVVWLDWYLATRNRTPYLIYLDVSPKVLRSRMQGRGRADDKDATARKRRLEIFYRNRKKIIQHFTSAKRIVVIPADGTPQEVEKILLKQLSLWHLPKKK